MSEDKKKQKLLIVVHRLNTGGVQRSLLSALRVLNYEEFDVTLYVRERIWGLPDDTDIDPRVSGCLRNFDTFHYFRTPRAALLLLLMRAAESVGKDPSGIQDRLNRYILSERMKHEKRLFPQENRYDIAIAYIQGETALFVEKYVPADRKIMFCHSSADDKHELHEKILPSFDRIAAVNEGCRQMLLAAYPDEAEKIVVVENYVDPEKIRSEALKYQVDRPAGKTVLCSCGRLSPEKGFDLALETARMLKERGRDFLWYIIGDGPERTRIENDIASLSLDKNIQLVAATGNPYPYFSACDIYVQPSKEESFGLTIAEAQILCRPVVTTCTMGGKHLVNDRETGLIARIDPVDLADKIGALIDDPALYGHIEDTLQKTDRSADKEKAAAAWEALLSFGQGE